MPKGIALHFGINVVDPDQYPEMTPLKGAENDARDMAHVACGLHYFGLSLNQPKTLLAHPVPVLGADATRSAILDSIDLARSQMDAGDILMVTFAGHGAEASNNGPVPGEDDGMDDYLCAHDGPVLDNELADRWELFPEDVRIVVVVDACNSGTITEFLPELPLSDDSCDLEPSGRRVRGLTTAQSADVFARHKRIFKDEAARMADKGPRQFPSRVLLLAACDERGTTYDEDSNGAFTANLKRIWNHGAFHGTHQQLIDEAGVGLHFPLKPELFPIGPTNQPFDSQPAFRI